MNIVAPLSHLNEIAPLAATGADEFYCSVVPSSWAERIGTTGVSRRTFSNLSQEADLAAAISQSHDLGKKLSLVMNAQHYTAEQLDCLLQLASDFAELGGDAVIVGDPVLLDLIASEGFEFGIHLSSIASCRNVETALFYRELGATRIIFPRDMTLNEIARLRRQIPELECETFILNDGCVFEEGVCHSIHLPRQLGGAICMDSYRYDYQRMDGAQLSSQQIDTLKHNDECYQQWLWYRFGCGFTVTKEGYPYGPCGLCALPKLHASGIESVKIAGRDAPLERKQKSVELVKRAINQLASDPDPRNMLEYAQGLRQSQSQCSSGYMCYYPEVLRQQSSNLIARTR
ncbi:MAG: U32 family peptidase [Halopseudomonas sp.]